MATTFSKDSKTGNNYIAFFDLDLTIISVNSGKTLIQHAYKKGLMKRHDLIKGFYLSLLYRLDLKDTVKIIDDMASWVKGIPENKIDDLSAEIFEIYIARSIRPEVESEINIHKTNGARTVILSSSILPVCQKVADYLGMDDVICSNLQTVNGILTGIPSGSFCFGPEKVKRLTEYCEINKVDPANSWYYGDDISDLPVLSTVGHPVCVNPDKKLKRAARMRGWKILL